MVVKLIKIIKEEAKKIIRMNVLKDSRKDCKGVFYEKENFNRRVDCSVVGRWTNTCKL